MSEPTDPHRDIALALDRIAALLATPGEGVRGEIAAALDDARRALAALAPASAPLRPEANHPEGGQGPTSYLPRSAR